MGAWEYREEDSEDDGEENGGKSRAATVLDRRTLLDRLVDGRLSVETPVRRAGTSRWRAAGDLRAFEAALYPAGVLGPLPAFDAPDHARPRASYPAARPWVRLWARLIDIALFSTLLHGALTLTGWEPGPAGESALGFATLLGWVVVEAVCMAGAGTTPGKALLRVRVRGVDGTRLDFETAFSRAFSVWLRGIAMGIVVAAPVTGLLAYRRLERDGVTTWDRATDCEVRHQPIGSVRAGAAAGILVLLVVAGV